MRRAGILQDGYSNLFASCMQNCLRALMKKFSAKIGYACPCMATVMPCMVCGRYAIVIAVENAPPPSTTKKNIVRYTQSDEMIVFIPPTNVVRGERQGHSHAGRVGKLTTLAAGFVTSKFVCQLAQACVEVRMGIYET